MSEYEIEYMVNVLEKSAYKIDEETIKIVEKIRNKRVKKALKIYIICLILFLLILFTLFVLLRINITLKLIAVTVCMIILIVFQRFIVDKIIDKLRKREYSQNLSEEFIERIEKQYGYRY
ncbi:hypothetical protein [Caviibacter abscessus]|uniref:hypothetical protein n=1 Tax=Caviibacter abscessus TaxID=1766719 RepID=UPI000830E3A3|nr:hypothetical protein [Caviibacter abscessus]